MIKQIIQIVIEHITMIMMLKKSYPSLSLPHNITSM